MPQRPLLVFSYIWPLVILLIVILLDVYGFRPIRHAFPLDSSGRTLLTYFYWGIDVALIGTLVYFFWTNSPYIPPSIYKKYVAALFIVLYSFKLMLLFGSFLSDVFYVFNYLWQFIFNKNKADETAEAINTSRRQFLNSGILLASSLPGVIITDGVVRGRYNYKVYEEELRFKDLPKAFDGLKIVQISDIHSGSFDSEAGVRRGIELIKAQNADLILFTGDIVNVFADEMEPWISLFAELRAPMGQYSVLGNHDYHSRWVAWKTEEEGIINHDKIIDIHNKIGFKLLNNDHVLFEKEGQKIALLGVENWGKKPFPQIGDIHKTLEPVPNDMFKVLMSHDPSHFDLIISKLEIPIHLTLSGHTHGAQFGIESKFIKWSPVQYRYPRWAGLYEENERYLYVNRGFGFLGFPGRVGIRPEITAITLRSLA